MALIHIIGWNEFFKTSFKAPLIQIKGKTKGRLSENLKCLISTRLSYGITKHYELVHSRVKTLMINKLHIAVESQQIKCKLVLHLSRNAKT